jgi:hypothetical protein
MHETGRCVPLAYPLGYAMMQAHMVGLDPRDAEDDPKTLPEASA